MRGVAPTTVRLWTIQPLVVLRTIERTGRALASLDYEPHAYQWLRRNVSRVLTGYTGKRLWWFYCEKPDLRIFRHREALGTRHVRIEVEIPSDRVCTFPLWAWDLVYCGRYLALSRDEYRAWECRLAKAVPDEDVWPLPAPWRQRLERSWQRLFTSLPARPWKGYSKEHWSDLGGQREAVAETILKSDVREVTHFVGASAFLEEVEKRRKRRRGKKDRWVSG